MSVDAGLAELVTFACSKEAYVYAPLPPATSYGHRAELWNPDEWLKEVRVKVVTAGDLCFVRMVDKDTGELFAECPLPHDGTALTTAVEPVVDSSRYFVVRVEDRESRKHAFVGVGFRERNDASDFAAALDDYRQYLRRKQEAEEMREEFTKLKTAAGGEDGAAAAGLDLSLKPGQTIHINLSSSLKRCGSGKQNSSSSSTSGSGSGAAPPQLKLAPPPAAAAAGGDGRSSSSAYFKLHPPAPSAAAAAAPAPSAAAASRSASGRQEAANPAVGASSSSRDRRSSGSSREEQPSPASNAGSPQAPAADAAGEGLAAATAAAAAADVDGVDDGDDWGDFCDAASGSK